MTFFNEKCFSGISAWDTLFFKPYEKRSPQTYQDFGFMNISEPVGNPSLNSAFSLATYIITTEGINVSSDLHVIIDTPFTSSSDIVHFLC
jgi:hypothetical protein